MQTSELDPTCGSIRSRPSGTTMMLMPPVKDLSEHAQTTNASDAPLISVVVPVLERLGPYEILFCLDPSPDRTEAIIREEIARNPRIGLLVFSRRFGQPAAT